MPPRNRRTPSVRQAVREAEARLRANPPEPPPRQTMPLAGLVAPPLAGGHRYREGERISVAVRARTPHARPPGALLSLRTSTCTVDPASTRRPPSVRGGSVLDPEAARRTALRWLLRSAPEAAGLAGLAWDERPGPAREVTVELSAVPLYGLRPARPDFLTQLSPDAVAELRRVGGRPDTVRLVEAVGRRLLTGSAGIDGPAVEEDLRVVASAAVAATRVRGEHVRLGRLAVDVAAVPFGQGIELVVRARIMASAYELPPGGAGAPPGLAPPTAVVPLDRLSEGTP
jgi:hypothetical protein